MKSCTKSNKASFKKKFPVKILLNWYAKNKRDLPWRHTQEPYKIWISEVMLQQTTSATVINYYNNFLKSFPNLQSLSSAKEEEVLQAWAGLGYYSRAKNLHKSAKQLQKHFPTNYQELLKLPGFGNYTARSLSSFAFKQSVGVLDTNVIRFVCRYNNLSLKYWLTKPRQILQDCVDAYALQAEALQKESSATLNQALIEIAAIVCSYKKPKCIICPLSQSCKAFKEKTYFLLPLKKVKVKKQLYTLNMQLLSNEKNEIALDTKAKKPFLKNILLAPCVINKVDKAPKKYDFVHYITVYKIYVSLKSKKVKKSKKYLWVKLSELSLHSPSSLTSKALKSK